MAINLKQISTSDSDNIKLDKVNYNFDQLVANGGGPQGPLGPKGDTGFQGVMGPQGFQGTMGFQGNVGQPGANTESYWKRIDGDNSSLTTDTLFPVALVPGALNPPVISIGFLSSDPEYNTHQSLNNGQSPYQWIINRKAHFYSNLRFKSSDALDNHFDFRIHYDQAINKTIFRMSFKESGFALPTRIIWNADNHIFKSNVIGTNILSISTNLITFDKDAHFNSPVKINSELYIENAAAGLNKIATSVDASGLVTFKSIQELGGTVPYGTIISILPSVFADNTRFINAQTIDLTQLPNTINDALKIIVGAGIGDYEGWYLCNGQYWTDGTVQGTTLVPDLNSFSYSIPDNTASTDINSQGNAGGVPNNAINIVGGADINMTANFQGAGTYAIGQTIQTNDVVFNTATGATPFKIKKLPQIIYLAKSNLYWSDKGTGQAPTVPNTFIIDDINNSGDGCPTVSSTQTAMQGSSYTFTMTVSAQPGFYFGTTISPLAFTELTPGYNVTNIVMGSGTYPTTFTATITVTSQASSGTVRTINFNSSGEMEVVPSFPLILNRTSGQPSNATVDSPADPITVNYSPATGYTFDIKVTTESDSYLFVEPLTSDDIDIPFVLAGYWTVNSRVLSGTAAGYSLDGRQITMNVTVTSVALGTSSVGYAVSANAVSQGPLVDLSVIGGSSVYPIYNSTHNTSYNIQNNSQNDVYIKLGSQMFVGNFSQSTIIYASQGGSGATLSVNANSNTPTFSMFYWTIPPGGNISGNLYYVSGATQSWNASLWWSYDAVNGPWVQAY